MPDEPNIRILKRTRKRRTVGDIFAISLPDDTFIFGRVIGADLELPESPFAGSHLIYVYDVRTEVKIPELRELVPSRLVIPPLFINDVPWSKGYFENVAHEDVTAEMLLDQHCFWDVARKRYVDETHNTLELGTQLCGIWAMSNYRRFDDLVSDALGFPRAAR